MPRRSRRLAAAIVLLAVAGLIAVTLVGLPKLSHDRDRADRAWKPLLAPLAARYRHLAAVADGLRRAAPDRTVGRDLASGLKRWDAARPGSDVSAQAGAANALEGLAARARATVNGSARLGADDTLKAELAAFDAAAPAPASIAAYDDAARRYQQTRQSALRRFVAAAFGYDARPTLAPAPPPT